MMFSSGYKNCNYCGNMHDYREVCMKAKMPNAEQIMTDRMEKSAKFMSDMKDHKMKYSAGDKVTFVLENSHADRFNEGRGNMMYYYEIKEHIPAPKYEQIVIWQFKRNGEEWISSTTVNFRTSEIWDKIRKITIDPLTLKAIIEVVK